MWHDARSHFQESLLWFRFLCEVICRHSSISPLTPCLKGDVFTLPPGEATPCKVTSAPDTKHLSSKEPMTAALGGTIPPPCKSQSQKLLLGLGQQTSAWGLCHLGGRQHRATNLCLLRGHSHSLTAPVAIAYLRTLSRNLLIIVSITFMLT